MEENILKLNKFWDLKWTARICCLTEREKNNENGKRKVYFADKTSRGNETENRTTRQDETRKLSSGQRWRSSARRSFPPPPFPPRSIHSPFPV